MCQRLSPASCHTASMQFSLVTGSCVRDASVREWDAAVAMLTPGKKKILYSRFQQLKKSDFHISFMWLLLLLLIFKILALSLVFITSTHIFKNCLRFH